MKILIIGSGGREHALAYKFSQSKRVSKVFVSPGNAGMKDVAEILSLNDFDSIEKFCHKENIAFVFIGPEQPLAEGIVDFLTEKNIKVVGPSIMASQIESSKAFAKDLMKKYKVPTAEYNVFSDAKKAIDYLEKSNYPIVIKADGLAAGKGVIIAYDKNEAILAVSNIMMNNIFSGAGKQIVIEEFLTGWETSIFAFSDGENFVSTIFSQDHKQIFDGDKGPNTGGMGAYAPVIKADKYKDEVDQRIFRPILQGMKKEGYPFKGVLFAGLMITKSGPKVIEFNCRFGDPETQVILMQLETDLVDISEAIINNKIKDINLKWKSGFSVDVVASSAGYPGNYKKGIPIKFSENFEDESNKIFYAGVKEENGQLLTNGGRVLAVTSHQNTLEEAITVAYKNLKKINFEGMYYRKDIAKKGLGN